VDQARNGLGTDLASQLEDLLSAVWRAEANWRFDDRLDLAAQHALRGLSSMGPLDRRP